VGGESGAASEWVGGQSSAASEWVGGESGAASEWVGGEPGTASAMSKGAGKGARGMVAGQQGFRGFREMWSPGCAMALCFYGSCCGAGQQARCC
jgi:hypothetical protein